MNKPRYMEDLFKIIFLWLGIGFVVMGMLVFFGIMRPTADSAMQEPVELGAVFLTFGIAFIAVSAVLKGIVFLKNKLHDKLLMEGTRLDGVVESVYLQKHTQYGKESPYRIVYSYTYLGKDYHRKSCLLWEKPDCRVGGSITVYANNHGRSIIQL